MDANAISALLEQTLVSQSRLQAEQSLKQAEKSPGFLVTLLQLVSAENVNLNVRFAASLYFKNFIKRHWIPDADENMISEDDRTALKAQIIGLMVALPDKLSLQLSEAVAQMAVTDFPEHWQSLIPDLVSRLSESDYRVNNGILQTAHSLFKRYRHEFKSDQLFAEIKYVLDSFCLPYWHLMQNTDKLIDQNAGNSQALHVLMNSMILLCKIFLSLNSQDLPEFFEDHMAEFMALFKKYLAYQNPLLDTDDDEEVGPVEKVKASICEIIDLYTKKYEEEFKQMPEFVQIIWNVATLAGQQTKYDHLVSTSIQFLSSVAKHPRHSKMFTGNEALSSITEKVVLPNVYLRESDIELFEDNPIEYIRRDLEGSDADTRRRSAADLVRSLAEHFENELTSLIGEYFATFMQKYNQNKQQNWKDKDMAIYLLIAITAKAGTVNLGATKTNANINIGDIFSQNILPDLQTGADDPSVHPVLKVDALKFLNTFRHQLSKQQLISVLPLVIEHLKSSNYVVHTYAAVCVERMLFIKVGGDYMFTTDDVKPFVEPLLGNLFTLIEAGQSPEKVSENDYLIKSVMRVLFVAKSSLAPFAEVLLKRLVGILELISKNPSNPKFNHYVFESISSMIRIACAADITLLGRFEALLFPPIQAILQMDIPEFTPYVLQILALLMSLHKEATIPDAYTPLLPPLLQPPLWENHGNVPALVNLLEVYLMKDSSKIVANNQLPAFLGIFQKLIASRANEAFGFELLVSIYEQVQPQFLQQYNQQIFQLLLVRLQSNKTGKFALHFVKWSLQLFCNSRFNGVQLFCSVLDQIQPKLPQMLFQSIFLNELKLVMQPADVKIAIVGVGRCLCEAKFLHQAENASLCAKLIDEIVKLIVSPLAKKIADTNGVTDEEIYLQDVEESGYKSVFVKLNSVHLQQHQSDAKLQVADPEQYFLTQLKGIKEQVAGALQGTLQVTKNYLSTKGVSV
ncbi:hypothetical protein MP228_002585 [Amoeboaphelidium protococcarum]|nr:hypothetical protein MP228_002585 [Amoeboaphelidium protococcarum]